MTTVETTVETTAVDMWFDPVCPWAWIGSRWLLEVEQVRQVRSRFRVFGLAAHNDGREVDDWYRQWLAERRGPARVVLAAERAHGSEVLRDLYTALGNRIHLEKAPIGRELYLAALEEAGLPAGLADAADDAGLDPVLLAGNRAALDPIGEDLGVPAIHIAGPDGSVNAFFGPVVSPIPRGEAAGRLWDGILLVTEAEGFFELKRGRTCGPIVD
ncbi:MULTISPECIES: DsbA family protein [Kitasatospora]|uniref:DsbA family protein n=1 Tax=Kitasatospora cystarginea TaxID=58350 RepID=A0ABN3DX55_9ACTN